MSGDHNMNQTTSGWRKRQIVLNKKAEDARELGLDYEIHSSSHLCTRPMCVAVREAVQAEREAISDEWHSSVYSDLESGVQCLNEQAAKDWLKNYPEISKFGAWLEARGNT